MKKLALALLLFTFPLSLIGQGSQYEYGSTVQINYGDTVAVNFISAAQFTNIMGHLDDDLYAASQNFRLIGSINNDALVAAKEVNMSGSVGDMMLALGETVIIDGEIAGDLFAAANNIIITSNARIHGNAAIAGNEISIEGGTIDGWLRASGDEISLNGSVGSYTELYGNDFSFGSNYRAATSTSITTNHELERSELGSPPANLKISVQDLNLWLYDALFSGWFYLSLFITGVILITIFRQATGDLYLFAREHSIKNTGLGALLFVGIPIAAIVLMIFILTIPLSAILLMLYGLALLLGYLLASISVGTMPIRYFKIEDSFSDYYWGLALGMLMVTLLSALPFAGWIISLLLIFYGFGSLISYIWELRKS